MKHLDQLNIRDVNDGAVIAVKVVPGSSRDRIAGVLGDALKINVSAAPEKGKANKAIAAILAGALNVEQRRVSLIAGTTKAHKQFHVAGMSAEGIRDQLARRLLETPNGFALSQRCSHHRQAPD